MRTVLCFGDSNTHGTMAARHEGDRRRHPRDLRWTTRLAEALGDGFEVITEGHPGRTTVFDDPIEGPHKSGLRALPALLESHRPLDLVVVMLGTNDLKARFSLTAHDVAAAVDRLVREINASDCGAGNAAPRVLVAAPVRVVETGVFAAMFAGAAGKSAALPGLLQAVAARQGAGFVDLDAVAEVDLVDGIHLDATAHERIGAAMAEAVLQIFNDEPERT